MVVSGGKPIAPVGCPSDEGDKEEPEEEVRRQRLTSGDVRHGRPELPGTCWLQFQLTSGIDVCVDVQHWKVAVCVFDV